MEQYNVTGMSCAACSARVEKAVNQVPGVTACSVSLLTNSMGVEGTADAAAAVSATSDMAKVLRLRACFEFIGISPFTVQGTALVYSISSGLVLPKWVRDGFFRKHLHGNQCFTV